MLYAIEYWIGAFFLIITKVLLGIVTFAIRTVLFVIKFTALLLVVGLANVILFVVTRLFGWKA